MPPLEPVSRLLRDGVSPPFDEVNAPEDGLTIPWCLGFPEESPPKIRKFEELMVALVPPTPWTPPQQGLGKDSRRGAWFLTANGRNIKIDVDPFTILTITGELANTHLGTHFNIFKVVYRSAVDFDPCADNRENSGYRYERRYALSLELIRSVDKLSAIVNADAVARDFMRRRGVISSSLV